MSSTRSCPCANAALPLNAQFGLHPATGPLLELYQNGNLAVIQAVGMSTVFEVLAARHMGARVLGISCLTNLAAGLQGKELDHSEVTEIASMVRARFQELLTGIIGRFGESSGEGSA